jgi:CheY-like chemotaxis protein
MKKILVVDDNEDILYSIKNGLEETNNDIKINTANNGIKCLEMLVEETPDLILLDLMMPNMNGWEVLETIQRNMKWRNIPIFIISSSDNPEFKESAEELGITFIEKPFNINNLKTRIDEFLIK